MAEKKPPKDRPSDARRERARANAEAAKAADRRQRNRIYVGTAIVLVLIVAGSVTAAVVANSNDPKNQATSSFGVAAADAKCQPVITDPVSGASVHVGPGTSSPDTTHVDYATVPPSSGAHYAVPAYPNLAYYSTRDTPVVEQLVHNLEHGYTILWYDPTLSQADQDTIRDLATNIRASTPKFIAAPWDTTRGELPDDAALVLSHWGASNGYRQVCGAISGEAVAAFVAAHPSTDSPEPDAA